MPDAAALKASPNLLSLALQWQETRSGNRLTLALLLSFVCFAFVFFQLRHR
jgi:hypothetical protein